MYGNLLYVLLICYEPKYKVYFHKKKKRKEKQETFPSALKMRCESYNLGTRESEWHSP